jgi:hypothetical protein
MGYTGINNANAFTGGLMQGIGLYNDIRRTKLYEEDIKYQRERQKEQDRLSMRRAEADLRNLDQQHEIAQQEQERRQFMLKAGDLADKLRGISGITDENARQEALDTLALSVNDDPFLVQYLDLNPQMGTGQGRKIVGFHVLNPNEKNPGKHKYTPLVANEALKSVGPYTADNTARWPQQAGISFDIEALDRIAGRQPVTRKVVSAVPEGGKHPVNMYEEEALGLMPGDAWRYQYQQDSATRRAAMRGSGKEKDPWTEYQNKAAKFFQTHKNIATGKFYDMNTAWEAQKVAEQNGIFLVFNKGVDPETGAEGVHIVDHRPLDASVEVAPSTQLAQGAGQPAPAPSQEVEAPTVPGYYTDTEDGQDKYWDGKQFAKVKVNGQWMPVPTSAPATPPAPEDQPAAPVPGGIMRPSDVNIVGAYRAAAPPQPKPVAASPRKAPGHPTVKGPEKKEKPEKAGSRDRGLNPGGLLGKWLKGELEIPEAPRAKGGVLGNVMDKGKAGGKSPLSRAKDAARRAYDPTAKVTKDDVALLEEVAKTTANEQLKREILQAAKRIRSRVG